MCGCDQRSSGARLVSHQQGVQRAGVGPPIGVDYGRVRRRVAIGTTSMHCRDSCTRAAENSRDCW